MNALTLDGSPVNSTIGRAVETFTKHDIDEATKAGIQIGEEFADHRHRVEMYDLKEEYRRLSNALAAAIAGIDGVLSEEMRKTLEQAYKHSQGVIHGKG